MDFIPVLETQRLVLRPWKKNKADAKALYSCAKDARIGPAAGWRVHRDVNESLQIIRDILSTPGICAVTLKETKSPVGSVGLTWGSTGRKYLKADEAELGYWIGAAHQRKGYAFEAAQALIDFAFTRGEMQAVWCAYYEGNEASARLQEKLGFIYDHTEEKTFVAPLNEYRTEHFTRLTKKRWEEGFPKKHSPEFIALPKN